jgi:uncharacterized protein
MRPVPRLLLLTALALANPAASADYASAMTAFDRGDYAAALPELRLLAESGQAAAQNTLGVMYDRGLGLPADLAEASTWFRRAAAQGDAKAQANLGVLHEQGRGVARDLAEAVRWYRLAAAQGRAVAENNLAAILAQGRHGPPDLVQAYVLFDRAARHFPAETDRTDAAINRDAVGRRMTPAQLELARQELGKPENLIK